VQGKHTNPRTCFTDWVTDRLITGCYNRTCKVSITTKLLNEGIKLNVRQT